jgi:flagellar motor component MotA/O6-methylguanine-DNA--protein-cysteine methyltransferase
MSRQLPPRPSLEQFKKQAKDLRRAHQSGDPESARRIKEHLPRLADVSEEEILKGDFSLQEAQHVVAREYGCRHWNMLCALAEADFDLLAGLSDEEIQRLLRLCDQEDFTRGLKSAGALVRERFLSNMSQRVRRFILEEIEFLKDLPAEEAQAAQRRVLHKAVELDAGGQLSWPDGARTAALERAVAAVDFGLLAGLDDRGAQALMREIEQKDLCIALKGADAEVQEKFLGNMSARVSGFIRSEMELLQAGAEEIREKRQRILVQAANLAVKGTLSWPDGSRAAQPPQEEQVFQPSESLVELVRSSLDALTVNDMAELWQGIADQARREGILSLEVVVKHAENPFLREALTLAVDGTEPDLLREHLERRSQYGTLRQLDIRGRMIVEGLLSIMAGDNPKITRHKLDTLFEFRPGEEKGEPGEVTAKELKDRLRQTSPEQMSLDQLADLFMDMGFLARQEGASGLEPLQEALEGRYDLCSELLRRGLELLLDRIPDGQVREALETQLKTRLEGLEKSHRRVIVGIMGVQKGLKPQEVEKAVRQAALL